MIDNQQLQQINSWIGGMNLDTSDQFLPDNSYREAFNLRLTADTNGISGSLHNIEGVRLYQHIVTNLPTLPVGKSYENIHVVHTDSIRKYGIIVVKATVDSVEYYYIFRFINKEELNEGEVGTPKLIFGPCPTQLGEVLSSVTRYEDADNIKFYFADGKHPIRSINISPVIDDIRPMTDDGSFSIYPTALLSQPEFVTLGSGNLKAGAYQYGYQLFTKNGAETEISPLTGLIYTTASSISPTVSSSVKGSLKGSNTNKSIQIKIDVNDPKYDRIRIISVFYEETTSVPTISILGDLKLEHKEDGSIDTVYYQDINNLGIGNMTTEEFNMITSVHFAPKLLETKNHHLFASDIQYQDNTFDVDFDSRAYSYALTGTGEFITILKNNDGVNEIIATRDDIMNGVINIPEEHDCINPFSIIEKSNSSFVDTYTSGMNTSNIRCAYTKYNQQTLWGGEGLNVSWRFRVSDLDDMTDGSVKLTDGTYYGFDNSNNGALARDFEGVWTSNVSKTGQLLNTSFLRLSDTIKRVPCNYSNPIIASKLRSLQRDEVYRYGIVLYNKFNQAAPVKWIADIRTPDAGKPGFESFVANRVVSFREDKTDFKRSALSVRPLGIEFTVKNLPDDVTSYEIVRCRRTDSDRATVSQGIIGATNHPVVQPSGTALFPNQFMMLTRANIQNENNENYDGNTIINADDNNNYRPMTHSLLNFASPEVCYTNTYIRESLPKTGMKLSMVKFVYGNTGTSSISNRDNKIYIGGTTLQSIGKLRTVQKTEPLTSAKKSAIIPYFYTENLYRKALPMFEQSNVCNLTNGVTDIGNWTGSGSTGTEGVINSIIYPTETSWKDYQSKLDFIDGAGAFTYTDWVINGMNKSNNAYSVSTKLVQGPHGRSIVLSGGLPINISTGSNPTAPMVVTGSRILSTGTTVASDIVSSSLSNNAYYNESVVGTQICNLRKNVVPYSGYNYTARQFNTYISIGGFVVTKPSSFVEQVLFGGDVYINRFRYVNLHYFAGLKTDGSVESAMEPFVAYEVPLESPINLAYVNGADINQYVQIDPANVNGKYIQDTPLYVYNSIYSVEPYVRLFTPETLYDEWNKHIDVRTYYSLNKSNDETIDQWTKFQPLNYLDVDTRHGAITNLRTFGNELIFWQENALGKFAVNDRAIITDNNNMPLALGTSGVLSRYDYVATVNGMKNGHNDSDCQSDNVLYWFDYDRNELCAYSGGSVVCISKAKYVQTYLNNLALDKSEQIGKPICTFDKYYNEMIATLSNSESIVYNENLQMFTSFYSLVPEFNVYFNSDIYFTKGDDLYKYNDNVVNNGFGDAPLPIMLKYIVNKDFLRTKVFDNIEFVGYLNKDNIRISYTADNIQSKDLTGAAITRRENNLRAAVPRANVDELFANRLRGRVLYCTLSYTLGNSESTNIVTNEKSEYMTTIVESDYIVTNNVERRISNTAVNDSMRFVLPYMRTTYRASRS